MRTVNKYNWDTRSISGPFHRFNSHNGMSYKRSQMKLTLHVRIVSGETGYETLQVSKAKTKASQFYVKSTSVVH